ncbi:glycerol-3-phosphate dehydrogenase/oxidase [Pelagibius sp. 7325]|uniref:glycerol-3-phosphate dehydrogenase/oxidase n=1 Tax=Pelagibius sp. 7325 TaxID=3131994 RepID=UPI0030EF81FF
MERLRADAAFDVIVVGGGINGIGVFRELCLQGLRVLLVERGDFCSGCSAAPSRMIHGGLRYLENGEYGLVRESLRERDALLANAPHMVRPLPTTIPITSLLSGLMNGAAGLLGLGSRPAPRGALPVKLGLSLYDWVTRHRRILPRHTFRSAAETHRRWPKLTTAVRFSATYHDAWISYPERLGIELILDSLHLSPESVSLNYAEILPASTGFCVIDKQTGERLPVTARAVVNATGAWLDEAIAQLNRGGGPAAALVSGTKGSHLIIDNPRLFDALGGHMIFFENSDSRICIVFPYLGRVLAGATDIRVKAVSRVRCEDEERDYILESLRLVFPTIALTTEEVVYSYSGIRPLPKSDHDFTGRISRGHFVHRIDGALPQYCMVGGKWTTFRAFAEQTADRVLTDIGRRRKAQSLDLSIGGGAEFPQSPADLENRLAARHGITPTRAAYLVDLYGTRSDEVLQFCSRRNDDRPLDGRCTTTAAEIAFLIRHEFATGLGDLLLRRTPLAIRGEISSQLIRQVADVAAIELGWSGEEKDRNIDDFIAELGDYHGVSEETLEQRTRDRSLECA